MSSREGGGAMTHRGPYCLGRFTDRVVLDVHSEKCSEEEITCPMCGGRKTQHLHGASFSGEEMEEMGPEFREDYQAGMYEHPCDHCSGSGKTTRGSWQWHLESEAERSVGA